MPDPSHRASKTISLSQFTYEPVPSGHQGTPVPLAPAKTIIPTNIHLDLVRDGRIADPHIGLNECDVQWVHDRDWLYKTEFAVEKDWKDDVLAGKAVMELVFEGLDTFCTIKVNGKILQKTDNMFLEYRVRLNPSILKTEDSAKNILEIIFESPMRVGNKVMEDNGGERVTWNGHYCRNFVRKAQYHFGWDWGPSLATSGPWKPISLNYYTVKIGSTTISPQLRLDDLSRLGMYVRAVVHSVPQRSFANFDLNVTLTSPTGLKFESKIYAASNDPPERTSQFDGYVEIENPELWYPTGYGLPNLYTVDYTFSLDGTVLDSKRIRTGFRHVELVQDHLAESPLNPVSGGRSFYFKINNIPMFMGGSNWIPADSFLPRITKDRLKHLIKTLAHDVGNQNMIRVWGGGIYESDDFYDICDEQGILVWQDVCLACGDYPANLPSWESSIEGELRYQISGRGLANRPSLIIWAGSNEDYQVADEELGYDKSEEPGENGENWKKGKFPSRWLYERSFARIVGEEYGTGWKTIGGFDGYGNEESKGAGRIIYWPGSPWGGEDSTDRTVGDVHQWNVWGGIGAPYQRYNQLGGRFNSEFGMTSYPALSTIIQSFLPNSPYADVKSANEDPEFHPQSASSEHHQRAHSFEKRFMAYLGENFRVGFSTYDEYVHLSQLLQSEAMGYAYRGWRRLWGGNVKTKEEGRLCGGALVWQLDDVWPVTSWALVDYFLRPKPALYAIARALDEVTVGIERITSPDPKPNGKLEALVNNKTVKQAMSGGQFAIHSTPHIFPTRNSTVVAWVANKRVEDLDIKKLGWSLKVSYINIDSGEVDTVYNTDVITPSLLTANGTTIFWEGEFTETPLPSRVVHATIANKDGHAIARHTDWPQPLKHYDFARSDRGVVIKTVLADEGGVLGTIQITVQKPVKGFWMNVVDGIIWGRENGSDICPGDVVVIEAKLDEKSEHIGVEARRRKWAEIEEAGFWYYGIAGGRAKGGV